MAKDTDVRATPAAVVRRIQREFGVTFDLDVCAVRGNRVVRSYFGPDHAAALYRDALNPALRWSNFGTQMWMNPPYSEIPLWLGRVEREVLLSDYDDAKGEHGVRIVALLPSSTSAQWFHKYIWNRHKREWRPLVRAVQFWPKRINFEPHTTGAKWPSIVVMFGR